MKKSNPGFMLAEKLAEGRGRWDKLSAQERQGMANELVGSFLLLLDLREEKVFSLFLQKFNQLSFNHVDFEMWLNELSGLARQKIVWRLVVSKREIIGIEKEESGKKLLEEKIHPAIEVEKEEKREEKIMEEAPRLVDDSRKKKRERGTLYYSSQTFISFAEELPRQSCWFSLLEPKVQKKLKEDCLRGASEAERRIVHLLPLLWRGGLNPDKGLADLESIFFVLKETFEKEAAEELVEPADKRSINQLVSEIVLKDKLGRNTLRLVRLEMQEFLERLDLPDLGVIIVAYQRGKFRGALQSTIEKLIEKVEAVLPEALVRRLFLHEEEKQKTE